MRVLFAGGGTGGHLYPALAVADELRRSRPDAECAFVGSKRGIESRLVPQNGFVLHTIRGSGFRRMGMYGRLRAFVGMGLGLVQALWLVARWRPDVVVATGGYASLATGIAAAVLRRPLLVQEQNSVPGLVNRWLGRLAREVHVAFRGCERWFGGRPVHLTGNPLRAEILHPPPPLAGLPQGVPVVLVVGGSRGARSINTAVASAIPILASKTRIQWLWQTGELDYPRLEPAWGRASGVQLRAYFDDVAAALVAASLLVCRSGAMTLAEITALGKPAILVPFPGAVDDHQTANARELVDAGAAILLPDAELSGERLSREIGALLADPERLARMGQASTRLARPRATLDLVAAIDRQARKHR